MRKISSRDNDFYNIFSELFGTRLKKVASVAAAEELAGMATPLIRNLKSLMTGVSEVAPEAATVAKQSLVGVADSLEASIKANPSKFSEEFKALSGEKQKALIRAWNAKYPNRSNTLSKFVESEVAAAKQVKLPVSGTEQAAETGLARVEQSAAERLRGEPANAISIRQTTSPDFYTGTSFDGKVLTEEQLSFLDKLANNSAENERFVWLLGGVIDKTNDFESVFLRNPKLKEIFAKVYLQYFNNVDLLELLKMVKDEKTLRFLKTIGAESNLTSAIERAITQAGGKIPEEALKEYRLMAPAEQKNLIKLLDSSGTPDARSAARLLTQESYPLAVRPSAGIARAENLVSDDPMSLDILRQFQSANSEQRQAIRALVRAQREAAPATSDRLLLTRLETALVRVERGGGGVPPVRPIVETPVRPIVEPPVETPVRPIVEPPVETPVRPPLGTPVTPGVPPVSPAAGRSINWGRLGAGLAAGLAGGALISYLMSGDNDDGSGVPIPGGQGGRKNTIKPEEIGGDEHDHSPYRKPKSGEGPAPKANEEKISVLEKIISVLYTTKLVEGGGFLSNETKQTQSLVNSEGGPGGGGYRNAAIRILQRNPAIEAALPQTLTAPLTRRSVKTMGLQPVIQMIQRTIHGIFESANPGIINPGRDKATQNVDTYLNSRSSYKDADYFKKLASERRKRVSENFHKELTPVEKATIRKLKVKEG